MNNQLCFSCIFCRLTEMQPSISSKCGGLRTFKIKPEVLACKIEGYKASSWGEKKVIEKNISTEKLCVPVESSSSYHRLSLFSHRMRAFTVLLSYLSLDIIYALINKIFQILNFRLSIFIYKPRSACRTDLIVRSKIHLTCAE